MIYEHLFNKSPTFRKYWHFAQASEWLSGEPKWKFVVDPVIAHNDLPANNRHSTVNVLTKTIYILPDDLYYLSENGFVPIETERKLTHEMMHILTNKDDPSTDLWTNRGPIIHLTEKILKEAGFQFPNRLAYAVVTGEQLRTGNFRDGIDPRRYQTTAQRVRDIEEHYIKSAIFHTMYIDSPPLSNSVKPSAPLSKAPSRNTSK